MTAKSCHICLSSDPVKRERENNRLAAPRAIRELRPAMC